MANVVDFSALRQKVTPWGEVLDPITEELKLLSSRQHAEDMQDARLEPTRVAQARLAQKDDEAAKHNRALEQATERQRVGKQTVENTKQRTAAEDRVREALANEEYDKAEQLGSSYQEMDPTTASVNKGLPGFKVDRGGEEPPLPSADSADTTPEEDAAVKQWQERKLHPEVMISGVKTTPEALRLSASKTRAADMAKTETLLMDHYASAQRMGDPMAIESARRQLDEFRVRTSEVASGALKPGEAAKAREGQARGEDKQAGTVGIHKMDNDAKLEAARIRAEAEKGRAEASGGRTDDKTEVSRVGQIRQRINDFSGAKGYDLGPDRRARSQMKDLIAGAEGNAVTQRSLANVLMRVRGGEKGVTTDKDRNFLIGKLEGVGGIDNTIDVLLTGQMAGPHLKILQEAMGQALAANEQREQAAKEAFATSILGDPIYQRWGMTDHLLQYANQMFGPGGDKEVQAILQAKTGAGGAAPSTGARPARDPSNPDDPNGPGADRPLDGEDAPARPATGKISREDAIREAKRRGLIK